MKKITVLFMLLCLGFYSIKAQAPVPNGSFENWTSGAPDNWVTKFTLLTTINFVNKSTSFQDGQFAIEVFSQSITPIPFGSTYQIPGVATLGTIVPDVANATAKVTGGVPYTDKPSKLKGWYQYAPQGTDSAIIYTILTKWNAVSGTRDTIADGFFINTATQSTYAQFTVDLTYRTQSIVPDTMNIVLLSSGMSATPDSKLLVDNMSFELPQNIASNSKLECNIYPNPSNGVINVSLVNNQKTTATLFNSLGQEVCVKTLSSMSNSLDFSSLPKGIYLLDLRNNDQRIVKKITLK
jgi:hypothetical protein